MMHVLSDRFFRWELLTGTKTHYLDLRGFFFGGALASS